MILDRIRRVLLFLVGMTLVEQPVAFAPFVTITKLFGGLLAGFVAFEWMLGRRSFPAHPKNFIVIFFALAVAGSFAVSHLAHGVAFGFMTKQAISWTTVLISYVVFLYAIASAQEVRAILGGMIAGITLTSLSVVLGYEGEAARIAADPTMQRAAGVAGDPNNFGLDATIAMAAAAGIVLTSRSFLKRALLIGIIGLIMFAITKGLSRGTFVALGVMVAYAMGRLLLAGYFKLASGLVVAALLALLAMPSTVFERLETMTSQRRTADTSIQARLMQYERAFEQFAGSPLIGVGIARANLPEAFGGAVKQQDLSTLRGGGGHNVTHNAYLHVAAEMGLLGLLPYLSIIALSFFDLSRAWAMRRRFGGAEDGEIQNLCLLAGILQIGLVGCLMGSMFLEESRGKPLWLVIALSTSIRAIVQAHARAGDEPVTARAISGPLARRTPAQRA